MSSNQDLPRPPYGPADALRAPRYTGVRSFARCPNIRVVEDVGVAVVGVPFDTATSYRPGARFGPEAIRSASVLLRPWHAQAGVDVFAQSVVDWGDLDVTPGNAERTAGQIADGLAPLAEAGVATVVLGGDHSIVLGELRAHAAVHGPLGVVLLDAHTDLYDAYYGERYFHGTPFLRALEEGLIDPSRSVLAGMRGPAYGADDLDRAARLGFTVLDAETLRAMDAADYGALVRARVGDGPAFLSFDIDVLDPAFAPGTGTPEMGGLLPHEAQRLLRALQGLAFCGFDVVEVAPPFDTPGQTTALNAAGVAYELLALAAVARRAAEPA